MGVKFLTEEWVDQVKSALNSSDGFQRAAGSQTAKIQQVITGTAAYMSGKLKVQGDLMKLMQLQGPLGQIPQALNNVDVEY